MTITAVDIDSMLFLLIEANRHGHSDGIGERVGERAAAWTLANNPSQPKTHLDVAKWLGTVIWPMLFGKPVETLRTNSKDTFILVSSALKSKYNGPQGPIKDPLALFGIQVVHGALKALQLETDVRLDSSNGSIIVTFIS